MPAAHRLAVNTQSAGHFPLSQATVKEFRGSKSPSLQLLKIPFDAFWIAHFLTLTWRREYVTILYELQ